MRRWIGAIMLAALPALAQPRQSMAPSGFTTDQRTEIVQILRDALRTDPSILREAASILQQDELRQQSAAARDAITAQHGALTGQPADPVAGPAEATATVVEFYDTRCPYCRRLLPTLDALLKADPSVRIVYKDLPILGPNSLLEARALLAAQRQGNYAAMQAAVMREVAPSSTQSLRAIAERLGLDGERLQQDMADPAIAARLEANLQLARTLHVEGTPAFIIGNRLIPGAVDLAELQDAVMTARQP